MLLIPDFEIQRTIKAGFKYLWDDLVANNADQTKSVVYKDFAKDLDYDLNTFDGTDSFTQIKSLLDPTHRRFANIMLGYSMEKHDLPRVMVMLGEEEPFSTPLGMDEGYDKNQDGSFDIDSSNNYRAKFSQTQNATYGVVITSTSSVEIIHLHQIVYSILMGFGEHLVLKGFQNLQIGSKNLDIDQSVFPIPIFHRNVVLNFTYEKLYSSFFTYGVSPSVPLSVLKPTITVNS